MMVSWKPRAERGDTIVEVMFAVAVFAFLAAGSLAIMNRGIATTQRSLEITQVRQAMNDQAELLRFVQQDSLSGGNSYGATWKKITTDFAQTSASDFNHMISGDQCTQSLGSGTHPFALFSSSTSSIQPETQNVLYSDNGASAYPQVQVNQSGGYTGTYGLWIEAEKKSSDQNFIDFHIRACWDAPGSDVPVTLGTIVRLYKK